MKSKVSYSVVIPVYNSDDSLIELTNRLEKVFNDTIKDTFEIVFIDDWSINPKTQEILRNLSKKYDFVNVYLLTKNFGQGGATLAGLSVAIGQWIITMDDDLQHRPEDIPLLLKERDHDVVIGRFIKKQNKNPIKIMGSNVKGQLDQRLLGLPKNVKSTSFKLLKSSVVKNILSINTPRPFIIALILNVTSDITNVEIIHQKRFQGKSNYTIKKSIKLFSNLIISNSSFIARQMSIYGFLLASLSIVFGLYILIRKIIIPEISQGWTSLMIVSLFNLGILLFSIGLIGEYIYRLEETTKKKPTFLIKKKL